MAFYQVDKRAFVSELKHCIAEVVFIKEDGNPRKIKCTLDKAWFTAEWRTPELEARIENVVQNNDLTLPVWDIQVNGWRTILLDRVLYPPQVVQA